MRNFLLISASILLLAACTDQTPPQEQKAALSFLAFGDSGYHYDYPKKKVADNPVTLEQYLANEKQDWLEDHKPEAEFKAPPTYTMPGTDYVVEASGAVPVAKAMQAYCESKPCEFAIMLGDNIYPDGADGSAADKVRFEKIFDQPYKDLGGNQPGFKMWAAFGNHDWKTSRAGRDAQLKYALREDTKLTMKDDGIYSFKKGDAEFFVIDTNMLLAGLTVYDDNLNPDGSEGAREELDTPEAWEFPNAEDKKQLQWLKDALKNSTAKWKIVYGHHTLWSSGGSKYEQAHALRALLMPTLCEYADMYFAGHEHDLEAHSHSCEPELGQANPLPLIISGAGAKQRSIHSKFQAFQEKAYPDYQALWMKGMTWGFSYVELFDDSAKVTMITTPNDGSGKPVVEKVLEFKNRIE